MKNFLVVVFILLACNSLKAEDYKKFLRVKGVNFKIVPYPWANELNLAINIRTRKVLLGANLSITVSYNKRSIATYKVEVAKMNDGYYAKKVFEPLNKPAQEVLLGEYAVTISLISREQNPDFLKRWEKITTELHTVIFQKLFVIGNERGIKEQDERIKDFYVERMKNLNTLYLNLRKKETFEFNNRNFNAQKWKIWFYNEFFSKIKDERKTLEIHTMRVYSPRYEETLGSMKYYCDLLERLGKKSRFVVLKKHNKNIARSAQGIDPFSITSRTSLNKEIESFHRKSARELGISLKKEIGYIPPPR